MYTSVRSGGGREVVTVSGGAEGLLSGVVAYHTTALFSKKHHAAEAAACASETAARVWGLIEVAEGQLRFRVPGMGVERMLAPGCEPGVTEPGVPHEVAVVGPVRFRITFYRRPGPTEGSARERTVKPDVARGATGGREGAGNVGSDVPAAFA